MDEKDMVKITELLVQAGYKVKSVAQEQHENWSTGEKTFTGALIVTVLKGGEK